MKLLTNFSLIAFLILSGGVLTQALAQSTPQNQAVYMSTSYEAELKNLVANRVDVAVESLTFGAASDGKIQVTGNLVTIRGRRDGQLSFERIPIVGTIIPAVTSASGVALVPVDDTFALHTQAQDNTGRVYHRFAGLWLSIPHTVDINAIPYAIFDGNGQKLMAGTLVPGAVAKTLTAIPGAITRPSNPPPPPDHRVRPKPGDPNFD